MTSGASQEMTLFLSDVVPDLAEIDAIAKRLETASASTIVEWAYERFSESLILTASFQDCVLIDIIVKIVPDIEVIFLDTGFHFEETLLYLEEVQHHYQLNLKMMQPEVGPTDWPCNTARCCEVRKVEPLQRALVGKHAWMSGVRRVETQARAQTPVVMVDERRGVVKVNPIVRWTDDEVERYIQSNHLPIHPLTQRGYRSIGCAPSTRPTSPGEDPRSGRWAGAEKMECGLHQ